MNRQTSSAGSDLPTLPPRRAGLSAAVGLGRAARLCRHRGLRRLPVAGRAHRAPAPAGAGRHGPGRSSGWWSARGRTWPPGDWRASPQRAVSFGASWPSGARWPVRGGGRGRHRDRRDRGTRHGRGRGHVLDPRRRAAGPGRGGGVPVAVPAHPHRDPRARRPGARRGARRGGHPPARLGAADTHADPEANRATRPRWCAWPATPNASCAAGSTGAGLPPARTTWSRRCMPPPPRSRTATASRLSWSRSGPAGWTSAPARSSAPPARRSPTPPSTPASRGSRYSPRWPTGRWSWWCVTGAAGSTRPPQAGRAAAAASPTRSWVGCGATAARPRSAPPPGPVPRWSCACRSARA